MEVITILIYRFQEHQEQHLVGLVKKMEFVFSSRKLSIGFWLLCKYLFSRLGYLVCFTRPAHMKYLPNAPDVTPRSLCALLAYASNPMQGHPSQTAPAFNLMYPPVAQSPTGDPNVSISAFYYQDRVGL